MTDQTPDHYVVLGVSRDATPEELKSAHRALSRRYHPDKGSNTPAEIAKFHLVQEAYKTLSNKHRRATYDRGIDPPDSLMELFKRNHGKRELDVMLPAGRSEERPGPDASIDVIVSPAILRDGGVVTFTFDRGDGPESNTITVPEGAGAQPWACIQGLGYRGQNNGQSGSLYIKFLSRR